MNSKEYGAWINTSGEYISVLCCHTKTANDNGLPIELYDIFVAAWVRVVWGKHAAVQGSVDAVKAIWPRIARRLLKNAVSVSIDFVNPFDGRDFDLPMERKQIARWIMSY